MIQGLDHLVIACPDPDAAAIELESTLGIACTGGGRHERFGTRNRIAWLADGSYLELIGIEDPSLVSSTPVGDAAVRVLQAAGAGLATYALAVTDLDGMLARLRAADVGVGPVQHGSRRRSDGELVEWRAAFPHADLGPGAPPFLIEHVYSGAEWGPEALAARERFVHPIGSPVRLAELAIGVASPSAAAAAVSTMTGSPADPSSSVGVSLRIGHHRLRFVVCADASVPAVVTLRADIEAGRAATLLGMRFELEPAATSGTG